MYCANCGKPLEPNDDFCAFCGEKVEDKIVAPMPVANVENPAPQPKPPETITTKTNAGEETEDQDEDDNVDDGSGGATDIGRPTVTLPIDIWSGDDGRTGGAPNAGDRWGNMPGGGSVYGTAPIDMAPGNNGYYGNDDEPGDDPGGKPKKKRLKPVHIAIIVLIIVFILGYGGFVFCYIKGYGLSDIKSLFTGLVHSEQAVKNETLESAPADPEEEDVLRAYYPDTDQIKQEIYRDANGRTVKKVDYEKDGDVVKYTLYAHYANGNVSTESIYSGYDVLGSVITYSEDGMLYSVQSMNDDGDPAKIDYYDEDGEVSDSFYYDAGGNTVAETTKPTAGEGVSYRVTTKGDNLNLRQGPGTDYDVIGQIPNETVVVVTSIYERGGWGMVTYEGKTGWVRLDYLVLA